MNREDALDLAELSTIIVGSTIPAFAMEDVHWHHWLENAEAITAAAREAGHEVRWLATLQVDARGEAPFDRLFYRLNQLRETGIWATTYRFSLDLGEERITSGNRFAGICIGRNLIIEAALRDRDVEWIYFADSDISAPDDVLVRLLELDWPVCGAHVPTYCLNGRRVHIAGADVRRHWNTAGSLLVRRDVFRRVPWRWDPDAGDTDDPATQHEMERLGWPTLVRHDVICRHNPEQIGPLEQRGLDLAVYR